MESHNNKIEKVDGYVVYRRKKKRTTSEAISLDSEACRGKVDDHADTPQHGAEKDRCDEGGRLIFCKACCNSYHPQCLSPPLESIPDGDWQCPNCSNDDGLSETMQNFKTLKKGKKSSYSCSLCSKAKKKLKLSEDETVKSKSSKSSSAEKPNASAEFHESEAGNKRVATVSDPGIFGNIKQVDKLLMLSEACVVSMEELHNSYKDRAAMQQPDPVNSEEDQTKKEGCAKLCASQKDKVALKNKGKEPLSSPRQVVTPKNKGKEPLSSPRPVVTPKQSSDLQIVEYDELVALNALTSWKDTPHSPCMGLSGQDKTTPNSSSHLKNDSASGITSRPENIDTTTSKRPSGFMKYKRKNMDGWSELKLDALWVAVRRHGQGNWEAILADPIMKILKNKTPQELATKWEEETLKIFPSAVPLPVNPVLPTTADRSTTPHASLDINGNTCTGTTAVQLPSPRVPAHVSGSGTQRFPASLEDEILRRRRKMLSQNHGILRSHNQGSSSSVSHSIRRIGSAPQRASNVNLNPKISELLLQVQALSQRSNLGRNMTPMGVQAVETAAEAIRTKRHPSSTNAEAEAEAEAEDEPRLLLGGLFQLPKVVLQKKSESHDTSNTSSNPSQIEEGEGSSHKTTSST